MIHSKKSHLGGHENVTHLDEGAFSYLLETFKPQTFLDIGCGPGGMLEIAKNNGVSCLGIDGDMSLFKTWQSKNIVGVCNDYSESGIITGFFDLCWSVEFFEHIEELYLVNVFRTLKNCKVICMTHALPGKNGHHHVNCRTEDYWIDMFKKYDFSLCEYATREVRQCSTMKREFMRETGKVFINEN